MNNMKSEEIKLAIEEAESKLFQTLTDAKEIYEKEGEKFVDGSIGVLCNGITIYATLFKKCDCKSQKEFEDIVKNGNLSIKKAAENLLEAEEEWGRFLEEVEKTINKSDDERPLLQEGDVIDMGVTLYPVDGNREREAKSLQSIASSCRGEYLLLVLNRHFA